MFGYLLRLEITFVLKFVGPEKGRFVYKKARLKLSSQSSWGEVLLGYWAVPHLAQL